MQIAKRISAERYYMLRAQTSRYCKRCSQAFYTPAARCMPADRLKRLFTELGRKEAALYLFAQALSRVTGGRLRLLRYHLVAQPVIAHADIRPSAQSTIREVHARDPLCTSFPRPKRVIAQRFADGATCLAAEHKGRFAGFIWLARDAYNEDEVRCRYELADPQTCVWDYDVYVEPDFRIGRTFSRLWHAANVHLAAQGVRWSLSRISAFNPTSQAAHKRLGIQYLGSASFLVAGSLQIALLDRRPFLHASLNATNAPVLRLPAPDSGAPTSTAHSADAPRS